MADNELHHVHTLLLQLQDVLREKFELEEEIEVLPAALKEKEARLEAATIPRQDRMRRPIRSNTMMP